MKESFTYDALNRLDTVTLHGEAGNVSSAMEYDAYGRILSKQADGQTVFDFPLYNNANKPHAIRAARTYGNPFPTTQQSITYTMFDKVKTITQGNRVLSYEYGYDHQRIKMEETLNGTTVTEKDYFGNCEIIHKDREVHYTYLSGPLGTFAVVRSINGFDQISFIYKDHLGSWTALSDYYGGIEQELSFDAWGNLRNPDTWTNYTAPELAEGPMFDRGFTGHEHVQYFGLINMNGRMYDPVMSSFLSVDNYVQCPDFSQSFNRYAYCLNNPLRYVDPDGEEFITAAIIIGGVIIGAYTGGALANGGNYNITQWNWDMGTAIGVIGGGIAGGLSAGAGFAVAGAGFSFCNTTAIAASSLVYSTGMYATGQLAGFDYDISMSIGVASYNFTKGEFGYLFKEGNSVWDNIGYGLGALTNASDIYRFATWDILSKEKKLEVIKQTIGDENVKVEYDKKLRAEAQYNKETNTITIGPKGLNRGRGWAQSTLQHEYKHHLDIMNGAGNKSNDILDWYAYCKELHNAEKNGLTIHQHNELIKRATDCGNNIGVSIGRLPKYTVKEWLRSFMYWF